jgi:hypothetical protein
MHTLRQWRTEAEKRGLTRIAELADYLQADELTHVKLATNWVRDLTANDVAHRDELVRWGRQSRQRIEGFWSDEIAASTEDPEVHFTFLRGSNEEIVGAPMR